MLFLDCTLYCWGNMHLKLKEKIKTFLDMTFILLQAQPSLPQQQLFLYLSRHNRVHVFHPELPALCVEMYTFYDDDC